MNVRIFLFDENPEKTAERDINSLKFVFSDYLQDDESVGIYPSIKEAIDGITKALKDSHVIVFLASTDKYAEIKRKLARTFGLDMQINEDLQNKAFASLNKILANSSSEEYAHCIVPSNAHIFALEDGLYSGFASISGNQTVICIPWENERTEILFTKQVIPYINTSYNVEIDVDAFHKFYCNELTDTLKKFDANFAIPKTNTSSYFIDYIKEYPELLSAVNSTDRSEKRGNLSPEKYIINLSIMAKELAASKYGIAISNAYYTGNDEDSEKVVYLAVTDDKKTSIRVIHSFPGENVEDFLYRTSGNLCTFICDFIVNVINNTTDDDSEKKIKKNKIYTIGSIILGILCVIVLAGIIFITTSNNTSDSIKKFISQTESEEETSIESETESIADEESTTDEKSDCNESEIETEETTQDSTFFVAG